ncbi:MAG: hypothetical protein PF961_19240 [Planctomycetota bacterium]|jgi:hypothetical protein|nr:hypothetical protein [Planctomycetota bacterium]
MADDCAHWSGALLWPQPLAEAAVIDMSAVEAIGVWAYAWFRAHPRQAVVAAPQRIRDQLQRAELPVLWYNSLNEVSGHRSGVSADERSLLWDDVP